MTARPDIPPVTITPNQASALASLVELHQPDIVVMPLRRPVGDPLEVEFLTAERDLRLVIDTDGVSWQATRKAAA